MFGNNVERGAATLNASVSPIATATKAAGDCKPNPSCSCKPCNYIPKTRSND